MTSQPTILYIDDEQENLDAFKFAFASLFNVKTALSAEEALKIISENEVALVLADQRMPKMTGIELCEKLIQLKPEISRMILTAYTETELLLEAIRRGHVQDYIVKPWKKSVLQPILEKTLEEYVHRKAKMEDLESRTAKMQSLEEDVSKIYDNRGMVGIDSGLKEIFQTIKKAAPSDTTILLTGETGTGKELIARVIHAQSKRSEKPFIPVHCAAFAKSLIESELFGHEKGAFTGADQRRVGRFELAKQGTIFLDEISEVPLEIQVKLLRVLQEREIQRVGGNQNIPIDVRLIVATNKDLTVEVRESRFREDLLYRLKVIELKIPPLRDRKDDIPILANYFLQKYSIKTGAKVSLSQDALNHLGRYDWPGNVRELENIIERAVILSSGPTIDREDLNLPIEEMLKTEKINLKDMDIEKISAKNLRSETQKFENQRMAEALLKTGGNIGEAARLLGMAKSTLFYRLKKNGLI